MKIKLLSPADIELNEAIKFYDHQLPGLGFRFFQEISDAVDRINLMPDAWPKIGERTRRCIIKSFPYAIFYIAEEDEILITAVAHLHRDPDHYDGRIT